MAASVAVARRPLCLGGAGSNWTAWVLTVLSVHYYHLATLLLLFEVINSNSKGVIALLAVGTLCPAAFSQAYPAQRICVLMISSYSVLDDKVVLIHRIKPSEHSFFPASYCF